MSRGSGHDELVRFRQGLYACFTRWRDALFELTDAALCATGPISSVPALSLEAEFTRSHGSLYKALAEGRVADDRMRQLLVEVAPKDWPLVFAVDASTVERCDAECSPERGFYYSASRHSAGQPIVAGWHYQWICQLSWAPDSWTAPMDVARLPLSVDETPGPGDVMSRPGRLPLSVDETIATVTQIRHLVGLLPTSGEVPLFVLDAGYDPIAIGHDLTGERCEVACRVRDDRVFYADASPKPNRPPETGGRPSLHGKRWKCSDPGSWPTPDAHLVREDSRYGTVTVTAWHGMHPRLSGRGHWAQLDRPPIVRGSVIRADVEHLAKPTSRAKKTLWLWRSGDGKPDLERCVRAYLRRFDIEHTFRFMKQSLGWTTPKVHNPEQADRWSWIVAAGYTELRLARGLVGDLRLPWEKPLEPTRLTPARVRRGFRRLRATLGSPASPPKSTTTGPGWPKGTRKPPKIRYPAVKRAA
ncbi:MAG: transposase [Acidimicrobiales bacterium]